MSSSTMIHGATIRRASTIRSSAEPVTITANQNHGGSALRRVVM